MAVFLNDFFSLIYKHKFSPLTVYLNTSLDFFERKGGKGGRRVRIIFFSLWSKLNCILEQCPCLILLSTMTIGTNTQHLSLF